jgi:glycosyltransferase involved in cell wall biosynthesis
LWVLGATINKAASMASGDYLGVLDHDDELDTLTLFEYVKTINEHPDADCIYCDEDKINEQGKYCDPWFKSNWNPVLVIRVKIYGKEKVYEKTSCRDTNIL